MDNYGEKWMENFILNKKHALTSASSVQYAISKLLEDQLLTYEDEGKTKIYAVADRFLDYWIMKNY